MRVYLVLLLIVLNGCALIPSEESKPVEVYFCPEDDCGMVFSGLINSSNGTVECSFYDLELNTVIDSLSNSRAEVRVAVDEDSFYENHAKFSGFNSRPVDSVSIMHNKFCVIDDFIVITGSFNPTYRGNFKNNNNVVVLYSKSLAKNYKDEFDELWHDSVDSKVKFPKVILNGHYVENYFCPEDCKGKILPIIYSANESIYFMTFSFTRNDIGKSLIAAHNRGVEVKGVFEKSQNNRWLEYERLKKAGLNVNWDNNPANMHHKVFIIDNKTVVTGSMNPSKNGLERNDENVLILHNERIAGEYLEEFECIWERHG
ncbi:MAG: phospholipase D-like domain-containing protein [Nanobdellota archaeon]